MLLLPGTFTEDVTITAQITMQGCDAAGATIPTTNRQNAIRPVINGRMYLPSAPGSIFRQISNFGVSSSVASNQDPSPIMNSTNCEWDGCGFTNGNYEGDGTVNGQKIAMNAGTGGTNASGLHVHHCEFFNIGGLAHRLQTDGTPSGWFAHAIYIVNAATGFNIHDNLFRGVSGSAIQLFGTGATVGANPGTITNNTFSNCGAVQTIDESVSNVVWTKNIFETCSLSGREAFSLGPDGGSYVGNSINDNIFHGNTNGDYGPGGGLALPATGITILNVQSINPGLGGNYVPGNSSALGYGPDWLQAVAGRQPFADRRSPRLVGPY